MNILRKKLNAQIGFQSSTPLPLCIAEVIIKTRLTLSIMGIIPCEKLFKELEKITTNTDGYLKVTMDQFKSIIETYFYSSQVPFSFEKFMRIYCNKCLVAASLLEERSLSY